MDSSNMDKELDIVVIVVGINEFYHKYFQETSWDEIFTWVLLELIDG